MDAFDDIVEKIVGGGEKTATAYITALALCVREHTIGDVSPVESKVAINDLIAACGDTDGSYPRYRAFMKCRVQQVWPQRIPKQ